MHVKTIKMSETPCIIINSMVSIWFDIANVTRIFVIISFAGTSQCDATVYSYSYQWTGGADGSFFIRFPTTVSAWRISVQFYSTINSLSVWDGTNIACSGSVCSFTNKYYNGYQSAGAQLTLGFQVWNVKLQYTVLSSYFHLIKSELHTKRITT